MKQKRESILDSVISVRVPDQRTICSGVLLKSKGAPQGLLYLFRH